MVKLLYIDLFCGAGGTSTGVNMARVDGNRCAKVIACVNHDKNAIASHASNHPEALHFIEDIRTLELSPLLKKVEEERRLNPGAFVVLWASIECTNFSKAKGGMARDADSRTLAEHLFRYIDTICPDYIQVENVEEFMSWGKLDENGKPISMDRGNSYIRWVNNIRSRGYDYQYRILNAADYGAYTSRKRFFGIFAKNGLPIAFPVATHDKHCANNLKPWKPVKDVLDFNDEGKSIFNRKKPLAEKTLQRIYAGLVKFVAGGKKAFLLKYNSMSQSGRYNPPGVDAPCPTVSTQNRIGIARVSFLSKQFSGHPDSKNLSVEQPAGTITTVDHHAFISTYYSPGTTSSIHSPSPTLGTKDTCALINVSHFIDMQYGNGKPVSVERPSNTITANPKSNLVAIKRSQIIENGDKQRYLMNPQFSSPGSSVGDPCFTLIAHMDKKPPYLVTTETGGINIKIYDTDSPMTKKIKKFMEMYGIIDITMRMLKIPELKKIMGFPENYVLIGTKADQKKFIGNAVEVNMARVLCEALYNELKKQMTIAI